MSKQPMKRKTRNPRDLNIAEWQELHARYNASGKRKDYDTPTVMRIENTIFSVARYTGGMTMRGAWYTYFEPRDPSQPANPDGTPYKAWLMVRHDFLLWVAEGLKKEDGQK